MPVDMYSCTLNITEQFQTKQSLVAHVFVGMTHSEVMVTNGGEEIGTTK